MENWLTHTLSAIGGALGTGLPLAVWVYKSITAARLDAKQKEQALKTQEKESETKAERDNYELERIKRDDVYKELRLIIDDLKQQLGVQDQRIKDMIQREYDCMKRSAELEARVKMLEAKLDGDKS